MVVNSESSNEDREAPQLDVYEITDSRGRTMSVKLTAEQAKARGARKASGKPAPAKARATSTKARKPDDK